MDADFEDDEALGVLNSQSSVQSEFITGRSGHLSLGEFVFDELHELTFSSVKAPL